jgi:phenylpropionate dioxygenase-like ring-hydroxylating dioxygenase large terminal subunit/putative sterol carrier protein
MSAAKQFQFPGLPKGWFVVALADEIVAGKVHSMRYFGRDLVAFRGESGKVHVLDAYCPHLGAHLAHGGKIEGDCIRCPFHGWKFEGGSGRCAEVPYADRIPPKAKIDALPTLEQDGVVYVFHDPAGGEPWPLPPIETEGWTAGRTILWSGLRSHPQEICENTVDTAHIGPVHDGSGAHVKSVPQREGEIMRIQINFQASGALVGMPDQINDVHLDVTMRGLGWMYVHTHVRNADVHARQRIYITPIDESTIDIRGIIHVKDTGDPAFTEQLDRLFYEAYCSDFPKDFPIWENKRYLDRPVLAKGDGPIGIYRRWCTQFYPQPASVEPSVALAPAPALDVPVAQVAKRGVLRSLIDRFSFRSRTPIVVPAVRESEDADDWQPSAKVEAKPVAEPPPLAAEGTITVTCAEDYYATLARRFVPSAAKGVDAVFQWELTGEGGQTFHAIVRDGAIAVHRGAHDKPTVTLEMGAGDYVKVINGELDGMKAFTSGKGKVKGSVMVAMKMKSLFPAA